MALDSMQIYNSPRLVFHDQDFQSGIQNQAKHLKKLHIYASDVTLNRKLNHFF